MKTRLTVTGSMLLTGILSSPLGAHHSAAMFERTPLWIEGTVVRFERMVPHTVLVLRETRDDGRGVEWLVEGPTIRSRAQQRFVDEILVAGAAVEFCSFPMKAKFVSRRDDPSRPSQHFVHGHVLRLPDGELWAWGPYGLIDECLGDAEQTQLNR